MVARLILGFVLVGIVCLVLLVFRRLNHSHRFHRFLNDIANADPTPDEVADQYDDARRSVRNTAEELKRQSDEAAVDAAYLNKKLD